MSLMTIGFCLLGNKKKSTSNDRKGGKKMSKTKKFLSPFLSLCWYFLSSMLQEFSCGIMLRSRKSKSWQQLGRKDRTKAEGIPSVLFNKANEPVMLPEFRELYERNSDIVGWLKMDGTRIEYPVMQNPQDASTTSIMISIKRKTKAASLLWTRIAGPKVRTLC